MTEPTPTQVLVIGAGVAGLSCAAWLRDHGIDVHVLEKSRGVGGRCATRRVNGIRVDHGLIFYHGDDPGFLSALHAVEPHGPFPWPGRIQGSGSPCQPRALRERQQRLAFADGVSSFPKHLARGVRIDLETRAAAISPQQGRLAVTTDSGRTYHAGTVVLAIPAGQAAEFMKIAGLSGLPELRTARALLAGVSMVRCLSVIAGYPPGTSFPDWDVCYPEDSDILQLASRDSSKRRAPEQPVFVFQTRPRWSADHWEDGPADWTDAVLRAARPVCGDRVTRPAWTDTHRWRYARLTGGDALTTPPLIRLRNGSRIGITGEAMAGDGGVQAAWLAGRRMAQRLLGELDDEQKQQDTRRSG